MKKSSITWLIDLDNTLHNASHGIFPAIHAQMNHYMADVLGDGKIPADEATVDALRILYWQKYGATLMGLIKHHGVNPTDFLHRTHQFNNLADLLRYESGLKRFLHRLPGRKILLTNGPHHYAQQVVRQLGIHFDHQITIESMYVHGRLRPKPSRWLLRKIIAKYKLRKEQCVLVEDTKENLRAAKQLGIRTVWVTQYLKQPSCFMRAHYIDLKVRSVKHIPAKLSCLCQ